MERKQLPEQIAFNYRDREQRGTSRMKREAAPPSRRRVVRTPDEIVPPTPWAERRARFQRTHSRPERGSSRQIKRTLAQTGMPAPQGQVRIIRPLPRQRIVPPVPVRSRRARRASLWRHLLGLFALLVAGILGASFALTSSTFHIRQVNVTGTDNPALVRSIQNMGAQGQNIFLVDVGDLATRIEALPMVASASIEKQWPDQLAVNVVERLPVLLWQTQHGTFSVDSHGVVIAPASQIAGADHLQMVIDTRKGRSAQQIQPGTRLNEADIAFALQVFERLPQVAGISTFTLRYDASNQGGNGTFIVASPGGWVAYLGGADDSNPLDNRLLELQQILNLAQQQQLNLATIDLRYGLRPVYTLKS